MLLLSCGVPLQCDVTMPAPRSRSLAIAAAVATSFTGLGALILFLMIEHVVSFQLGLLMLVALVGLYFGFGILILVYRFTNRLQ
jgi:hypothetical protein